MAGTEKMCNRLILCRSSFSVITLRLVMELMIFMLFCRALVSVNVVFFNRNMLDYILMAVIL